MKLIVKVMALVVGLWLPVSGFAAAAMPCALMAGQGESPAGIGRADTCGQSAAHHSGGQSTPLSLPCHSASGGASCAAPALAATPSLLAFESSAVRHASVEYRYLLFVPERLQRPPVIS